MDVVNRAIYFTFAGDLEAISKKINEGLHIDVQDSDGVTLLQAAVSSNHNDLLVYLLSKSANVDLPNFCGWTPLMLAAKFGHISVISMLLKNRAKVNVSNRFGLTALGAAVWSGNLQSVKLLLEAGSIVDQISIEHNSRYILTPIMIAAFMGHNAILQILLVEATPVNLISPITGWTPLMLATCNGHKETVHMLIQCGVNIKVFDACGRSAIEIADMRGHFEIKVFLQTATTTPIASEKESKLLEAVRKGDISLVKSILNENKSAAAAVDVLEGITALMVASMNGSVDIVKILVHCGANINAQNTNDGWTALMHAVFNKHITIVKYLLENGADVYVCANQGYTVFDLATHLGSSKLDIAMLLRSYCNTAASKWMPHEICKTAVLPFTDRCTEQKKRSQSLRLKNWMGDVAGRLQSVVKSPNLLGVKSPNPKCSNESASIKSASFSESELNDDVFEKESPKCPPQESSSTLSLSALMQPEKYLANDLRKHYTRYDLPLLLSKFINTEKQEQITPAEIEPKQGRVYLHVPNLLRNHERRICKHADHDASRRKTEEITERLSKLIEKASPHECNAAVAGASAAYENLNISGPSMRPVYLGENSREIDLSISKVITDKCLCKYIQKFKDEEIDIAAFEHLTEEDLNELEINTVASREKLMRIVHSLKSKHDVDETNLS